MLCKSLIQFSFDGWDCVPSLLFGLRPNSGRDNEGNGDLLQKDLCSIQCQGNPQQGGSSRKNHTSTRVSWTLTGKSGPVTCRATAPFSWLLVPTRFCLCPPRVCFLSPMELLQSNPIGLQSQIPWGFSVPLPDPQVGKSVVGPKTFLKMW